MEVTKEEAQQQYQQTEGTSQMSLSLAELIEVYIEEKSKYRVNEMLDPLNAEIQQLREHINNGAGDYPKRIIEFAQKLNKRHSVVQDDVLQKYMEFFGLQPTRAHVTAVATNEAPKQVVDTEQS